MKRDISYSNCLYKQRHLKHNGLFSNYYKLLPDFETGSYSHPFPCPLQKGTNRFKCTKTFFVLSFFLFSFFLSFFLFFFLVIHVGNSQFQCFTIKVSSQHTWTLRSSWSFKKDDSLVYTTMENVHPVKNNEIFLTMQVVWLISTPLVYLYKA